MRKYGTIILMAALLLSSCLKPVEHNPSETKETAFMYIMNSYAKGNGTANFKTLADNAVLLSNTCILACSKLENGEELTDADIKSICSYWVSARDAWMKGLALPAFSADDTAIRKALGSTPADTTGIKAAISRIAAGETVVLNELPETRRGFGAAEYMLYVVKDGKSAQHPADYTPAQMTYLCSVAEEISVLCTRLYAEWAGSADLADSYSALLNRHGISVNEKGYAWELLNPGQEESRFGTYQDGLLTLIDACIDFAGEFGDGIIGQEIAPFSLNSVTDYKSAFSGLSSCYSGKNSGQASLSTYTKAWKTELETEIKGAFSDVQTRINKLTEPLSDCEEDIPALSTALSGQLVKSLTSLHDFIQSL